MCTTNRNISLGFSAQKVHEGQHIVYVYNEDAERRRTMAKYLESGLLDGERVLYLADAMTPDEMISELQDLGVDVDESRAAMNITEATPAYTPSGGFTPHEMLDVVETFYHKAIDEGYTGARGSGEMTWSLQEGLADVGDLLEYEACLTGVLKKHPYTAVCQYDARRFSGEMIMDVLSVHPVMIVRGQLVKNPHFIDPQQFLTEYRARRAG